MPILMRFMYCKFFIYAQVLMHKYKLMRLFRVFQQAGTFMKLYNKPTPRQLFTMKRPQACFFRVFIFSWSLGLPWSVTGEHNSHLSLVFEDVPDPTAERCAGHAGRAARPPHTSRDCSREEPGC